MSDETIQYITTDYLIEVDGGEPTPAPIEYIVELGQVGVQGVPGEKGEPGFSPTVGYILNDNTFKINITNQDGVTQTPNLYDYFADKNGYLKVDGSNADNPITINGIKLRDSGYQAQLTTDLSSLNIQNINGGFITISSSGTIIGTNGYLTLGNASRIMLSPARDGKAYYGSTYAANNEIATIGDIGNATITLTQGGVTKGTFTTNQSGNATIDLDAGGGSITNPLTLTSTDGTRSLTLGINNSNNKIQSTYNFISGGSTFSSSIYLLAGKTDPITLTDDDYGKYTIGLKYDDDTIKVNQDGELYAVGGGGTTYTAGTGIDITSDVISIDTDVVAQLSDIPDVSNFVTNSSLATTLAGYVLSSSLATVATSGSYNDLSNKPIIPTNSDYVDLTTDQTVSGTKTFSNTTNYGANIVFNGSSNSQALTSIINNVQKNLISRNNSASYVYVGNTSDTLNLRGSGARPSYYANGTSKNIAFTDDIPDISNLANKDLSNVTTITNSLTSTAINPLVNKLTNADITVAPSSDINTGLLFRDNNDNNLAGFSTVRFTNGVQSAQISAINKITGTEKAAYFNVYVDASGNDLADASSGVRRAITNWGRPSSNRVDFVLPASGGQITAIETGYITIYGAYNNIDIYNLTGSMCSSIHHSSDWKGVYMPVSKGDVLAIFYSTYDVDNCHSAFIYAKGVA